MRAFLIAGYVAVLALAATAVLSTVTKQYVKPHSVVRMGPAR